MNVDITLTSNVLPISYPFLPFASLLFPSLPILSRSSSFLSPPSFHHQPLLVHCGTKGFPKVLHFPLSDVSVLHFAPGKVLSSSLHLDLCLSWLLQFLSWHCYFGCLSAIISTLDMTCSSPLFILNHH